MKKLIAFTVCILLLLSIPLSIYATDSTAHTLLDLADKQNDPAFSEQIHAENAFRFSDEFTPAVSLPTVEFYPNVYWEVSEQPLSDIIAYADTMTPKFYAFVGNNTVQYYEPLEDIGAFHIFFEHSTLPTYLEDLKNTPVSTTICGTDCTVEDVVCFDGWRNLSGIAVYLLTDVGTFVRYYSGYTATATDFTEAEFRAYAAEYYEVLSQKTRDNYGEWELNIIGDSNSAFLDFVAKREAQTRLLNTTLTVAVPIVAAAALVTVLLVIVKRRRANANR